MDKHIFTDLIKKDKYQVLLFVCPANIPLNLGLHPWFVLNNQGELSRWEVLTRNNAKHPELGHLHRNRFPPFQGIGMFPFSEKPFWKSVFAGSIEGEAGSAAKRMIQFIEASPQTYPFLNRYRFRGPN